MRLFLHDATPARPGEPHGQDGPTHAGTVTFEYGEHAAAGDLKLSDEIEQIAANHKDIVRIRCPEWECEWLRDGDRFVGQGEKASRVDGLAGGVRVRAGLRP
jgi:hypothetical protein